MSQILQDAAIPMLEESETRYLIDPHSDVLVVPFETEDGTRFLISIQADDEHEEALVMATILTVPAARLPTVATLLAKLNARYRFVAFSLDGPVVQADVCVELAHTSNACALLRLALDRLMFALAGAHEEIRALARSRRGRPRVLREANQIVDGLDFEAS
jgi:hypothetical protein